MTAIKQHTLLNNGVKMPSLGLGVFRSPSGALTQQTVKTALSLGYRHIDTAKIYGNEADVGIGIRESGIAREEIFITTKLWNSDQGYDSTLRACDESLALLGLDYVDLYLVHWPEPNKRLDTWQAMEKLLTDGKARAIGVSNYMQRHLIELIDNAKVLPTVNQIELSPYNFTFRQDAINTSKEHGIQVEAYSPLTKGQKLRDPKLIEIAERYGKSTAQLLIRWLLQKEIVVIAKSNNPERIKQNHEVFDFTITDEDMVTMEGFNENLVTGWDPTNAP